MRGNSNVKPPVIFSDFDGTITERDVIGMIMERFGPPGWKTTSQKIMDGTLLIREGVQQLLGQLPGRLKADIATYVEENVRFRQGFEHFARDCRIADIPLIVVSGGIDFFVEPVLRRLPPEDFEHLQRFYNHAVFHPDHIEVLSPYQNPDCTACLPLPAGCGCCKVGIMNRWSADRFERIAIGDSVTDIAMAKAADRVFARDRLIQYCQDQGIAFTPFECFNSISTEIIANQKIFQTGADTRREQRTEGDVPLVHNRQE